MNSTCRFPSVYLDNSFSGQPFCACLTATTKLSPTNAFPQNSSLIIKASFILNSNLIPLFPARVNVSKVMTTNSWQKALTNHSNIKLVVTIRLLRHIVFMLFHPHKECNSRCVFTEWATQSASHNQCIQFLQCWATKKTLLMCRMWTDHCWTLSKRPLTAKLHFMLPALPTKSILFHTQ